MDRTAALAHMLSREKTLAAGDFPLSAMVIVRSTTDQSFHCFDHAVLDSYDGWHFVLCEHAEPQLFADDEYTACAVTKV